jgi:hypothetical protein
LRACRECAGCQQKQEEEDQWVGFHGYFLSVGGISIGWSAG